MPANDAPHSYIVRMDDGTIKQFNPFSGTEVWTVPGRANRPLEVRVADSRPIEDCGCACAFCSGRVMETPPEKARIWAGPDGAGQIVRDAGPEVLGMDWAFRRVPNLFEIVSYDYWRKNYGHEMDEAARERMLAYIDDPTGRAHVLGVVEAKMRAAGRAEEFAQMDEAARLSLAEPFFGGGHDVIIGRRHYAQGAERTDQLASAGTLTPLEHEWYMHLAIDAMRDLYARNRYAKYVQVFQNWLKPAGASFDHLHKQLVAIDERPVGARAEIPMLRRNPNLYNEDVVDYAGYHNLIIAENEHAVAIAGFGHRYPTLEVWSRSGACQPWQHTAAEQRAMSDLVHAMHAATGPAIPSNEEWYAQPIDLDVPMPWRILIKWRVSTLAGFEGGSKIYVNTIDPYTLRDRVVPRLVELRSAGAISPSISIATECLCDVNSLRYNRSRWL